MISPFGTNPTSGDVRISVANGGRTDMFRSRMDPKRSFCLEQSSCEQFDIESDQSPMVSVIGRGGYCYECRQKTIARLGKERCSDDAR